eukprot:TRINITY_DN9305_c0_g1_i1.p1 TRINITY_DN9305_c0_g1~~TRINITY_DN9305_c0_g1_i1.p1  ORF type:complete len:754 (+),score=94.49 TRINITY_DN9305_c0_g1_i1:80-2263(+)
MAEMTALKAIHAKVSENLGGHAFRGDFQDDLNHSRFHGQRPVVEDEGSIAVCVPIYNEDVNELQETLVGLAQMQDKLIGKQLKVCIIQDGWSKVHPTLRTMMGRMYSPGSDDWLVEMDGMRDEGVKRTVVFPSIRLNITEFFNGKRPAHELPRLYTSVIIKIDNRKKHNSHDLFFRGFAAHHHTKFAFATDCGTKFEHSCLKGLVDLMERDDTCVACTGRQRVMSKWQQAGCETEGMLGWFLRSIQGYDYESSTVVYNGCYSLFGCLPVIPGPCGLFRLEPLLSVQEGCAESAFDFYAGAAHRAEESQDMLEGNTMLAEDRVLTYAALFKTPQGPHGQNWTVRWDKRAIFYFQAETQLGTLVAQRRRWLNGTVAAYIYVISELGSKFRPGGGESCMQLVRYRFIQLLNLLLLLIYVGIAIGPAIYAHLTVESVKYLLKESGDEHKLLCLLLYGTMFAVYIAFQWRHRFVSYDVVAFACVATINACAAIVVLSALLLAVVREHTWVQWVGLFYTGFPILLNAMIPDTQALCTLINPLNWLAFMLFMPTMQGYFFSLAIARTFDLSWGNRDSGNVNESLKPTSTAMIIIQNILNLFIMIVMYDYDPHEATYTDVALVIFAMLPTVVIGIFSVVQALGWFALVATILVEGPIIALILFPTYLENQLHLNEKSPHVAEMLDYISNFPSAVVVAGIFAVMACKGFLIMIKSCFCGCTRNYRPNPPLERLMTV